MNNNNKQFKLSYDMPLTDGGTLNRDIWYLANTDAAHEILLGTYNFLAETDPFTISILNQFAETFTHHQDTSLKFHITPENYIKYWRGKRYFGLHTYHWKVAADFPFLTSICAKPVELLFKMGSPLDRWSIELSVMLEKVVGVTLIDKLRTILLMEADFNFAR